MNQDGMQKRNTLFDRFSTVFFGSRTAVSITLTFGIALLALFYVAYEHAQKTDDIELPTGEAQIRASRVSTALLPGSPEIVVLNSYHAGHTWSDNEMAGFIETLRGAYPNIRLAIEYLDCKRHPGQEHFDLLRDLYRLKYGKRDIPVVIAADNPALEFAMKYRSVLFPRAAIVFCGVNNFRDEILGGQENITGLAETLDAVTTLRLALKLHPGTREVFIIHDATSTGLAARREAEAQMQGMRDRVSIRYVEDMNKKELTQYLNALPQDSLVLALAYSVFKDGEVIGHEDVARMLSANSAVPVYGVHQERLGFGIVGGSLLSGKLHGAQAARMVLKLLSGVPASDIPVAMTPPARVMFDYNQLVRFGIPLKTLPEGSVVVNRPISFLSAHRYIVASTLLAIILLVCGIIILGFNVYQRRRAEFALQKAKEELEMRVSDRTTELQKANEQLSFELIERKRAEDDLRASELRLKEAQRIAHVGSWDLDIVSNVLTWSDEIYRMFEINPLDFGASYEAFLDRIHPDDRELVNKAYTDSLTCGLPYEIDHRLLLKSGEVKYVHEQCETFYDAGGKPLRSVGTVQDITDRKRAEEELKRLTLSTELILNSAGEGIYGADIDGNIVFMNKAAQEMLGLTTQDVIGRNSHHLFHHTKPDGKPYPFEECPLHKSLNDGESYRGTDEVFWSSDGRMFPVEHVNTPLVDRGVVAGAVVVFRDISERKRAEEEIRKLNEELEKRVEERTTDLQKTGEDLKGIQRALMNIVEDLNEKTVELEQANAKLQELDRLKSMFVASMSHELRTPLNSVIGFSSIMLNEWLGPVNEEQKRNLATILRAGKHLLNLVNDVIDVSKIEAGKIDVSPEAFDLHDLIAEAVELITKEATEKGLAMIVENMHLQMRTDRRRLLQCVLNLLSNAVKFTLRGTITISAQLAADPRLVSCGPGTALQPGDFVEIRVEDTGIGIRPEDSSRMFHAFSRLAPPPGITVAGTGLGLYLTKKLVAEILEGDILYESRYGEGSSFSIIVPVSIHT